MTKLHISDTLSLSLAFVTSTQAILAQRGKGKSYTASVEAEELLDAEQQIVVLDPTGAWFGLRSSPDGKSTGYSIAVLGGEHADVPLEHTAGEIVGNAIAAEHFSAVIDLSLFRKGQANRFVGDLLETLYRKNRTPMHLFIDEADLFAPQKPFGDEARTLGACEDIVRRGRIRGVGCTLITQRPQALAKNVLSQTEMLTLLGMNHPRDLAAIEEWVAVHGDPKKAAKLIEELPSLPRGEAWFWNPSADIFKRATVRARHTFDSGRTPKAGERVAAPKVLAPIDIKRLGAAIAKTVERVKADDPKRLHARIAELEKQVAAKPAAKVETKTIDKIVIKESQLQRIGVLIDQGERIALLLESAGEKAAAVFEGAHNKALLHGETLRKVVADLRAITTPTTPQTGRKADERVGTGSTGTPRLPVAGSERRLRVVTAGETALPIGEAATLRALIQFPDGLRREQLTVLTGYKRSTRDAHIARLRERGFVDTNLVFVFATDAGRSAMPNAEPLPTGAALREYWSAKLPAGERQVLELLCEFFPKGIDRTHIDEVTGFKRSTRDAYLARLAAKQLVADVGRGAVKASDSLFEVA